MGAVNAWAESETGKRVMSNYIKGCAAKGATTRSGASVVDLDMMRRDAAILANEIVKTAASYDLAPSVMHGYMASDRVYGFWEGHKYTGSENVLRVTPGENYAYIPSKIGRPALQFMQQAVRNYNETYGKRHYAKAVLDRIYEEVPSVMTIQ